MQNPLNELPGYALRRASVSMMAELVARLETRGFRYSDTAVLLLIAANPGIPASAVGRELDIQRANLARILGRLEEEGILLREPLNGKSHVVTLTPAGEEYHQQLKIVVEEYERSLIERVPSKNREHLLPALRALWR